jgi:GcrA cell cycle regulator
MTWTDERVETLKAMWAEGKSASQIAKELGGITRNAVIGKVHRLGLSNRVGGGDRPEEVEAEMVPEMGETLDERGGEVDTPGAEAEPGSAPAATGAPEGSPDIAAPARPRMVSPGQPAAPSVPAVSEISAEALANLAEVEKKAKRLSLMELTERTCKWPIGDPATDDFWFCGLPAQPGKPYCEAHVAVAFQPMSARRDRRGGR